MTHTPGPWRAEGFKGTVVNDSRGTTLALHPGDSRQFGIEEVQANARLIAAAPDLLDALEGLEDFWAQYPHQYRADIQPYIVAMEKAITKAKGETT